MKKRDENVSRKGACIHMIEKILIDAGMNDKRDCMGRRRDEPRGHAYLIGKTLAGELDAYGYEVLFSGDVPELAEHGGAGRPAVCATISKRWGADAVFRLCVRAAELPDVGTVSALVFRRNSSAWCMAESVVGAVEAGSRLDSQGVRISPRFLLLRKTVCPCMIMVMGLPFRQKEFLFETEIKNYAECIAEGIHTWAMCGGR